MSNYKNPRAHLILLLQTIAMVFVTISPFLEGSAWRFHWPSNLIELIATLTSLLGFILVVSASIALGHSLTGSPIPKEYGDLIIKRPFSIVRNPIYSGGLLMSLGWSLWFRSYGALLGAIFLFFVLWKKTLFEEKQLSLKFGATYANYCKNVGRFLPRSLWHA